MTAPTHLIELHPDGHGPPADVRVRRFLKEALRGYGLRCTGVSGVPVPPVDHLPATNCPGRWRNVRNRNLQQHQRPRKETSCPQK